VTALLIAVLAILVLLYSTGPDGVHGTPHHGCEMDDWLQADRELQEKYNKNSGAVTRKTKPEGGTNESTAKQ